MGNRRNDSGFDPVLFTGFHGDKREGKSGSTTTLQGQESCYAGKFGVLYVTRCYFIFCEPTLLLVHLLSLHEIVSDVVLLVLLALSPRR